MIFLLSRAGGLSAVLLTGDHHRAAGLLEGGLEGHRVHPGLLGRHSLHNPARARGGGAVIVISLLFTAFIVLIV